MKKIIPKTLVFFLFLIPSSFSFFASTTETLPRKKIIIFSSKGGGGHISASSAIECYVNGDYTTKTINLFSDILKWPGEEGLYNFFLRKKWTRCTNALMFCGKKIMRASQSIITSKAISYLKKEQPSLVISVIPLINGSLMKACEKLNIPFLIVTNDLDSRFYINGIRDPKHPNFKYTLAFNDIALEKPIQKAALSENHIEHTGFPIRPGFFEKKNSDTIKKEFSLPSNKPIVMILMGATGSKSCYSYAKHLSQIDIPLHLMVCIGRDETIRKKMESLSLNSNVSMSIIAYTPKISDLMAVSRILITKPGPNSICESLQMNVPMLVDNTSKCLDWEKLNISFVEKNKFGELVTNLKDVQTLVKKYLTDNSFYNRMKQNLMDFKKEHFGTNIKNLVARMIDGTTSNPVTLSS